MKTALTICALALLAVMAFNNGAATARQEACVDRIAETNRAAFADEGIDPTDYRGAYATCRSAR